MLGEGSFGQVFKCLDHKYNSAPVAVKMVKNNDKYLTQAQIEIKILSLIKSKDPVSANNCIDLKNYFPFRKRIVRFPLHSACASD
jgi:dual specificity tyrosine-phosphorylation-regulated kinase 2/3/4